MSDPSSPVSIAPSVIRKLAIGAALAVVLVTISLGLAMHRGPSSPAVTQAAAVGRSGTVEPVATSQHIDDDATADLAQVGCEMMGDHIATGSSLGCDDTTADTADLAQIGCETMGDHVPTGSSLGCDDVTAESQGRVRDSQ